MAKRKEVNDADREAGEAAGPGVLDAEGGLSRGQGRAAAAAARPQPSTPPRFRLKRTLAPFRASDGSLYLVRGGSAEDFVVTDPQPRDAVLLETLATGFADEGGLARTCEQRGVATEGVAQVLEELERLGLLDREVRSGLDEAERARYDRQLIYFADLAAPGVAAEELQLRLAEAKVAILGCGGLGSWIACGLACAGVGELTLIDDDRVELSNLNRQLLFGEADIGEPKVEAARRALLEHNSRVRVRAEQRSVRGVDDLRETVQRVDLLMAAADRPPFELPRWVNRACLAAGTPYIAAGQFLPLTKIGPTVLPGRTACLECDERRIRREFPLYDELADFRTANPGDAATIGAASGLAGSMLAMEAIHLLSGALQPASLGCALILDLRTMSLDREEIVADPACPACREARRGPGSQAPARVALRTGVRRAPRA